MAVDLVIFDCDGVLVDTEVIAMQTHAVLGAELGWDLGEAGVLRHFIGRSLTTNAAQIADRLGDETARRWIDLFHERFFAAVDDRLTAVDGVVEALGALEAAGLGPEKWCVASGGTQATMRRTLGRVGLHERFDGRIFSAQEVERGKPAPDLFLHAARQLGVEPAVCAVVEDSTFGVRAATAAGMRSFGYAGGLTPPAWLEGTATVVFTDMRELPELLLSR